MTVVVTGASGFLGSHLVNALTERGHRVVGIDRRPGTPPEAQAITADLADRSSAAVDDALRDADLVYHLAAFPGVRATGAAASQQRRRDNIDATARVLDAVPLTTPVIVTSSSSIYGGSSGAPCAETDRINPRGEYAASKVEVERLCAKRVSAGGHVAVARPFTVAGEGQRPDMAIARWLEQARAGEPLTILGSLQRTRDLTDVTDLTEGLVRMGTRGVRATINLGTGIGQTLADITAAVAGVCGVELQTVTTPAGPEEPPATLADTRRCAALLGFVPRTDLINLVARQAAAATSHHALVEDRR